MSPYPCKSNKKYDAVIVAVGHREFKVLRQSDYQDISTIKPVIIDIKGTVENPTWRL